MSAPPLHAPSVLVIEDRAHDAEGHSPLRFAELAAALAARGAHVEVLTSRGWCRAAGPELALPIHTYSVLGRLVHEAVSPWRRPDHGVARAERTIAKLTTGRRRAGYWRQIRAVRGHVRAALLAVEARFRLRRMPRATSVVLVSDVNAPPLVSLLADDRVWLTYVFFVPPAVEGLRARLRPLARAAVAARERSRRRRGGRFVVVAPGEPLRRAWADAFLLEAVGAALAGLSPEPVVADARARLSLDGDARVALVFGARYPQKDVSVVLDAMALVADWELVAGGMVANAFPDTAPIRRVPGYVDADTRASLFSSADVVIVSFTPGFARNSGTLMNAVAWGVPVVCSDGCAPAEVVRTYRLGRVFTPGDPASLADAIRATVPIDPQDLARARAELSNDAVAARVLELLGD